MSAGPTELVMSMLVDAYDGLVVSFRLWGLGFCQLVWPVGGLGGWWGLCYVYQTFIMHVVYQSKRVSLRLSCVTCVTSGCYECGQ